MRRAATGAMVGIHGEDLIVIARSDQDLRELAANIMESFGPGPVVMGPTRRHPPRGRALDACGVRGSRCGSGVVAFAAPRLRGRLAP